MSEPDDPLEAAEQALRESIGVIMKKMFGAQGAEEFAASMVAGFDQKPEPALPTPAAS